MAQAVTISVAREALKSQEVDESVELEQEMRTNGLGPNSPMANSPRVNNMDSSPYITDTSAEDISAPSPLVLKVPLPNFSYDELRSPVVSPPKPSYLIGTDLEEDTFRPQSSSRRRPSVSSIARSDLTDVSSLKSFASKKPARLATKSFLESGGVVQPPALGNFPLPQKGQSLTSFLSSLSESMPDLDRENAHFNVSEALISAFETLKVQRKLNERKEEQRQKDLDEMFGTVRDSQGVKYAPTTSDTADSGCFHRDMSSHPQRYGPPPMLYTETEESE